MNINSDFYEINEFVDYLNYEHKKGLTARMLFRKGLDGSLKFVAVNPENEQTIWHGVKPLGLGYLRFKRNRQLNKTAPLHPIKRPDPIYFTSTWLPISPSRLESILNSEYPVKIITIMKEFNGKECELISSPFRRYSKEDLRIQKDEAHRFEREHFGINHKTTAEPRKEERPSTPPVARDLLINKPEDYSEIFEAFLNATTAFIKKKNRLPSREELHQQLVETFGFSPKKGLLGISSAPMDKKAYRSNYKRYTTQPLDVISSDK